MFRQRCSGRHLFRFRDGFDVAMLNSRLRIVDVKPEGKKNMSAKAFMLGRKINTGNAFRNRKKMQ